MMNDYGLAWIRQYTLPRTVACLLELYNTPNSPNTSLLLNRLTVKPPFSTSKYPLSETNN